MLSVGCGRISFDPLGGGPSDATAADTLASACPPFATLCDDFESGGLAKWTGSDVSPGAEAIVDQSTAHSGVYGLDATVPVEPSDGALATAALVTLPQSTGMLAVREWIELSAPLVDYESVIIIYSSSPTHYAIVGGDNNSLWNAGEDSPSGGLVDHPSSLPVPALGVWTCVELDYTFPSTGSAQIQVFVGDAKIVDVLAADAAPVYDHVEVGVARANMPGYHLSTDDVVIAPQHIGCQ